MLFFTYLTPYLPHPIAPPPPSNIAKSYSLLVVNSFNVGESAAVNAAFCGF